MALLTDHKPSAMMSAEATVAQEKRMEPWRCWNCQRLLAKIYLTVGSRVEIRCQCKATNIVGS